MAASSSFSAATDKGPLYAPLLDAIPTLTSLNAFSKEPAIVYPSRWYIVAVYSLFAATQGMIFSIPGVIAGEMQSLYGIDGNTIQLLLAYGPICYILFAIPFGWHMDRYGVRLSVLIATTCVLLSCILRCFASSVFDAISRFTPCWIYLQRHCWARSYGCRR
jgi:MFS family permease